MEDLDLLTNLVIRYVMIIGFLSYSSVFASYIDTLCNNTSELNRIIEKLEPNSKIPSPEKRIEFLKNRITLAMLL